MAYRRAILTHGGASTDPQHSDGTLSAAELGMASMGEGRPALDAVVHAVRRLEDDPRFNAGVGSKLRADAETIQMDASCMTSDGAFGAVAIVEEIRNPVDIAHGVLLHSSHILIAGDGARLFAREHGVPVHALTETDKQASRANSDPRACDTVGAVAFDGTSFAAALSSGGIEDSEPGRVGDVPLPGCGLYCGPLGAVASTGDGEFIALRMLAREVYAWLEQGMPPGEAVEAALALFDEEVDVGLLVLTTSDCASAARNGMAWSQLVESDGISHQ